MNAPTPRLLCVLVLLLALAGCASMPRLLGGGGGDQRLVLDGEQDHAATIRQGRLLTLDMRNPSLSGYVFAGASFNPALLRLDAIEEGEGGGRVRYVFTALAVGEGDVLVKIRKAEPGYRPDVFKRVRVTVEAEPQHKP